MRQLYSEFQADGGEIVAITFEPVELAAQLASELELPFPLLSNPGREAYVAYGLERGGWLRVFSPPTLWTYARLLLRGHRYQRRRGDWRQLGGDFVIDAAGVVRYEYRSASPADRPAPRDLLEILKGITEGE